MTYKTFKWTRSGGVAKVRQRILVKGLYLQEG